MKKIFLSIACGLVSLLFRLIQPLSYYWGRIWNSGRAGAYIRGLDPSVQFDGSIAVIGTADIRIGEKSRIGDLAEFITHDGGIIRIGSEVRINRGATLCAYQEVSIGDYTLIGEFVSIRDANHGIVPGIPIYQQPHEASPIRIGIDVWIGRGACILPGVTIGDGAVIGANSIVTKDIPANAIAAGIPAKVIRNRH
jgi:acetyltransferase-like isoleucine patch superfamily enzyme